MQNMQEHGSYQSRPAMTGHGFSDFDASTFHGLSWHHDLSGCPRILRYHSTEGFMLDMVTKRMPALKKN